MDRSCCAKIIIDIYLLPTEDKGLSIWQAKDSIKGVDASVIMKRYGITRVTAELLLRKKFSDILEMDAYVYPFKSVISAGDDIKDIKDAAVFLKSACADHKKIMVIGDYDCDGVMSSYILIEGFTALGAEVCHILPDRRKDGYGMRPYMADKAKELGCDIIVTCDNGISAADAVRHAKELGMNVVVTDHHEPPLDNDLTTQIIPPADYVIDTKQKKDTHKYKEMCGAGIALMLIQQMVKGDKSYNHLINQLLIMASIATVCDVVPLTSDNRTLVSYGLKTIKKTDNTGLKALIGCMGFKNDISSFDFGFRIGPAINAAGRLTSANDALDLFLEKDPEKAASLASRLAALNDSRKAMTVKAAEAASAYIADNHMEDEKVLLIYLPDCDEAIAGIVAGKVREKYYKPSMIVVDSGDKLKGSGRSIPSYHMQKELTRVKEHLTEFGGHALAAGFSLKKEELEPLHEALIANCTLTDEDLIERVPVDLEFPISDFTVQAVNELKIFEPVGQDNENIKFMQRGVLLSKIFLCGKEKKTGRMTIMCSGGTYTAVDFNVDKALKPVIIEKYGHKSWDALTGYTGIPAGLSIDILYHPSINDYNHNVRIEFIIEDVQ
jgi:single-stranded-DNA-specific exonuclease